jgi:succinate-semialdehyde dehydrogenase/glutarate-semialdehyde dehydrogenase
MNDLPTVLQSVDPTTGRPVRSVPVLAPGAVEQHIQSASRAFAMWRRTRPTDRADALRNLARLLRTRKNDLALLMAEEMGKPVTQGRAEIEKCAWVCDFYADHLPSFLAPQPVTTEWTRSYVDFQPLGPILGVMPWNFPF